MASTATPQELQNHAVDLHKHVHTGFSGHMAETYNHRTGGCNIRLGKAMIAKALPHLLPPSTSSTEGPARNLRILDNACGPLVLTKQLLETAALVPTNAKSTLKIDAVDLSKDFIETNKKNLAQDTLPQNVTIDTAIMDGQDLSAFPDNTFDASFTSLALFAFPDPVKGARELHRTLAPSSPALLTTWKNIGWLPLLHAVETSMGKTPHTQFPMIEPWRQPGKLRNTLIEAGFREEDVSEEAVMVEAWWGSKEEAAESFSETLRLMVGSAWTEGEKEGMREGFLRVIEEGGGEGRGEGVQGVVIFDEGGGWGRRWRRGWVLLLRGEREVVWAFGCVRWEM